MTTTKAKSKKAAPNICSEISNKISTRGALSVVEATRQNVVEAFSLPSNRDKLLLVATETTSSSLAGFLPVKIPSKRHTWVSSSVVSTPTKSPKVFNNRPINKLVFPSIASTSGTASTSSLKKMVKKTKSSEKWGQSLASAIVTPNSFVVPNKILNEISIASSGTLFKMGQDQPLAVLPNVVSFSRSSPVLEVKQSPLVGSPVLGNWADQMETDSSPSLVSGATFGGAWETITSRQRFAGSVHLTTLKIAKSLVVSEFGSPLAAVVLHDVSLGVSIADIKLALSVFGSITCVVLKPAGIWQYVVVYFEKLDSAVSVLKHWSVLMGKNSVRILLLFALVIFDSQGDLNSAVVKTGHLVVNCKISPPLTPKIPKVFKSCFVGGVSYAKASASLDSSEFLPLAASTSSSMIVGDSLVSSRLASLESDLVKLSTLVESIVKPVGSLVKLFEQFINRDLVSSSKLGLKVNEVLVHMGSFSKIVGKLKREVISLKKKCCMEDIDMSDDSEHPVGLDDEVFSNLLSLWKHKPINIKADVLKTAEWLVGLVLYSATLFLVIQKMSFLDKFSSRALM
ncbi:hypothetical protein G9A89_018069 [Geosiphon pyriformis]|nr:hypothetical protein G9A89_018069 [Geosiphon pyriformis]